MNQLVNFLKTGLDGAMMRQKAISNNISNVDTPNYKRQDVNFKETLKEKVKSLDKSDSHLSLTNTNQKHIDNTGSLSARGQNFKVATDKTGNYRNDRNNVDIDVEMAEMAKNQIYYNTLAQQVSNKFNMLNKVVDKGGQG